MHGRRERDSQQGLRTPRARTHWRSQPPLPGASAHTPPSSHSRLPRAPPPPASRAHLATLTPVPTPAGTRAHTGIGTLRHLQAHPRIPPLARGNEPGSASSPRPPNPRSRARPFIHTHSHTHTLTHSRWSHTPLARPRPGHPSTASLRVLISPSAAWRPRAPGPGLSHSPAGIGREPRAQPRCLPRTLLSAPPAPRPHRLPLRERDLARQPVAAGLRSARRR